MYNYIFIQLEDNEVSRNAEHDSITKLTQRLEHLTDNGQNRV